MEPDTSVLSRKLTEMQTYLDSLKCSEQFLKKENSILIEKLTAANSSNAEKG